MAVTHYNGEDSNSWNACLGQVLNVFGVVFFRLAETLQNLAKTGVPRIGTFSVVVSHHHTSFPKFYFLYEMLNRFAFITISD